MQNATKYKVPSFADPKESPEKYEKWLYSIVKDCIDFRNDSGAVTRDLRVAESDSKDLKDQVPKVPRLIADSLKKFTQAENEVYALLSWAQKELEELRKRPKGKSKNSKEESNVIPFRATAY